jgi:hypothetical protein
MSIEDELERCRPYIEAALEYAGGTHEFSDIVDSVKAGQMQFWPGRSSAAITEIVVYPRSKALHVFLAGGEMAELITMIDSAVIWGRAQGCNAMTMAGRKGWEKVLARQGWNPVMSVMEREIAA